MSKELATVETDLKSCGWLGRGLYCICDVNFISQLAQVHELLSSKDAITVKDMDWVRITIKEIIDVILEDNADPGIRSTIEIS